MIHQKPDKNVDKGWFVGPWNSEVPIPVGYANEGINLPHHHAQMFEIYLVARGTSTAVVNQQTVHLQAGDMLVVEPDESHTFNHSSDDYFHFVIQTPFIPGDKIID
ncbi:AraC family ligand binding domain-containing protein [Candidatus Leptofilum sp.]|uniref:AraC family ligand binding domain-containing protein n=1 Tax=Candidatus Leptofilum sp. TaxID=3241576 RepID=UPI003B5CD2E2